MELLSVDCFKSQNCMCSVQRYLQKNACQSDGISRQNPLWSKEPHGSLVLLESITHLCVFRELICIYICDHLVYNFNDLYHRMCFTQSTPILHVRAYIAVSNRPVVEYSNIRTI